MASLTARHDHIPPGIHDKNEFHNHQERETEGGERERERARERERERKARGADNETHSCQQRVRERERERERTVATQHVHIGAGRTKQRQHNQLHCHLRFSALKRSPYSRWCDVGLARQQLEGMAQKPEGPSFRGGVYRRLAGVLKCLVCFSPVYRRARLTDPLKLCPLTHVFISVYKMCFRMCK